MLTWCLNATGTWEFFSEVSPPGAVTLHALAGSPHFGEELALWEDVLIVTSPFASPSPGTGLGAGMASVFLRTSSGWRHVQNLTGRKYFNAHFGRSIAIADNGFMLISVPFTDSPSPDSHSGLVYLYQVNATALGSARQAASGDAGIFMLRERWQAPRNGEVNTFWQGQSAAVLSFGRAVGIQGTRGIVSSAGPIAFVFERRERGDAPDGPTVAGQLSTTTTVTDDAFGDDLSDPPLTPDPAFEWVHEISLLAPLPLDSPTGVDPTTAAASDAVKSFGTAVAVYGTCVAVGAPDYPTHPSHQQAQYPQTGGVFVYCENSTEVWRPVAALHSCDGSDAAGFGTALLFDAHALVVSAPSAAPGGHALGEFQLDRPGAVYMFDVTALDSPAQFPLVSAAYSVPRGSSIQGTGPGPLFDIHHAVITARDLVTRVAGPTSVHAGGPQDNTGLFGTALASTHITPAGVDTTAAHLRVLVGAPEDGVLYSKGGGGGCITQPCNPAFPDISRQQGVVYALAPAQHDFACPTPFPTPTPTASASNSASTSSSPSLTASSSASPSGTPSVSPSVTATATSSSSPSNTASASASPSGTTSVSLSPTALPTHTPSPSVTPSVTPSSSAVPSPAALGAGIQLQSPDEDPSGFGVPAQSPAPSRAPALRLVLALVGEQLSAQRISRNHVLRLRTSLADALTSLGLPPIRVVVLSLQEVLPATATAAPAVRRGRALAAPQEVHVTLQADMANDAQALAGRQRLTGSAAAQLTRAAAAQLATAGVKGASIAESAVQAVPSTSPSPQASPAVAGSSRVSSDSGLSSGAVMGISALIALMVALGVALVLLRRGGQDAPTATPRRLQRFSSFTSVHSMSTAGRGARGASQAYLSAPRPAGEGGVHVFKPLSQLER